MELNGYTYKRFPDASGRQVHVVETAYGRFEGSDYHDAMSRAMEAQRAIEIAQERAERVRQIAREEQAAALAFTDSRRA